MQMVVNVEAKSMKAASPGVAAGIAEENGVWLAAENEMRNGAHRGGSNVAAWQRKLLVSAGRKRRIGGALGMAACAARRQPAISGKCGMRMAKTRHRNTCRGVAALAGGISAAAGEAPCESGRKASASAGKWLKSASSHP